MPNYIFCSLTRISNLASIDFTVEALPRKEWELADYVVAESKATPRSLATVELQGGRLTQVLRGDLLVGAFGVRYATLEAVGDWKAVGEDGMMEALTGAGLFGKATSVSPILPSLLPLQYCGHVMVEGKKVGMRDFVKKGPQADFTLPVIALIGTSMSAGKTASGRIITRKLRRMGLKVVAAKITGAGRYRDVLTMGDQGAIAVFDFVDVGLPSTVCDESLFREALSELLSRLAGVGADVAVIEAGASPLEPYNGTAAFDMIKDNVCCTVLCASDPYAVAGVIQAFKERPNLVAGITANTEAGVDLVEKLTGVPTLNLLDESTWPQLEKILKACLPEDILEI